MLRAILSLAMKKDTAALLSRLSRQFAALLFFALIASSAGLWAADLKPEDVVAKHLDAIGSAQARGNLKSRVVQGGATYRILVGGTGAIDGKYVFASEGAKSNFLFKVNASGYLGEQFICDGNKTSVAGTYADKHRSEFGTFVLTQDIVLRDNLLGGVWSSGWALLDVESHKAKLHYEGMKKMDGRDLIALRYQPRKSTDLEIFLYFDPQTYQHVISTYKLTIGSGIGLHGEKSSAQRQETRYQIEERFSDFQAKDGLTMPTHYDLRFTAELASGFTKSLEWEIKALDIMNNQPIDARSFQPK
jgi:hypothetical protein